jgi:hypothetical protein
MIVSVDAFSKMTFLSCKVKKQFRAVQQCEGGKILSFLIPQAGGFALAIRQACVPITILS